MIRVESKHRPDFLRILTEPKASLTKQYSALLETEGVKLVFTDDAVAAIARFATSVNEQTENIGPRRRTRKPGLGRRRVRTDHRTDGARPRSERAARTQSKDLRLAAVEGSVRCGRTADPSSG